MLHAKVQMKGDYYIVTCKEVRIVEQMVHKSIFIRWMTQRNLIAIWTV